MSLLKVGAGPTPLLIINDADGVPGTLYAATLASQLPPEFLATFSLIGVDRRGTGDSTPVRCVSAQQRKEIVGFDPDSSQLNELSTAVKTASQECAFDLDEKLTTINSARTADDLEEIRKALGVSTLDAIGHGEGSRVLTLYADRHPDRVGRFVLDGSPDPALDAPGQAEAQAAGMETAFSMFAGDCLVRNCPLGPDPQQVLLSLLDQLRAHPQMAANGVTLTPGTALRAVAAGLANRSQWPTLAAAVSAAKSGAEDSLAGFVSPLLNGVGGGPPLFDAGLVTNCNNVQTRLAPEQIAAMAKDWVIKYPLFGGLMAQSLALCSSWPIPGQALPAPQGKGIPPVLVFSTAADPVTPEQGTQRTARQLPSGVLISWQGGGHGALTQSACAVSAAQHFLIDAQIPANNTACPA